MGSTARSQNRWPSLDFDVGAINSLGSSVFVAGFYYKTFMWPKSFWEKVYEPIIRRAAGLGTASREADPDKYERAYAHCELLVIGSGPTGLMAALTAARAGERVILADEGSRHGGSLLFEREEIDGRAGLEWADGVTAELASMPNVTLMPRTTVFGWYDGNIFGAVERVNDHVAVPPPYEPRQRYWRFIAKRAVLAAGAEERPIAFGGNDVPGVMLASAMRTYANRYAVAPGNAVVVFTNNDSGYRTARDMMAHGVRVEAIVDSRPASSADTGGARVLDGRTIADVKGRKNVVAVTLADGERIDCDTVAMAGGWSPIVNLLCHRGAKPHWDENIAAFLPPEDPAGAFVAGGSAAGKMLLSECLADGAARGAPDGAARMVPSCRDEAFAITPFWWVKELKGKAFVDFQNDATADDLLLARVKATADIEHAKRYTTTGMATDQGKLGNVNALRSSRRRPAKRSRRSARRRSGLTTRRSRSARSRVRSRTSFPAGPQNAAARLGGRAGRRVRRNRAVAALVHGFRARREDWLAGGNARGEECTQRTSAFATSRRWARSTCRAGTPALFSTGSIATRSRHSPSAGRATA